MLLGNGAGGFGAATNFAVGTNPYSVAVGDFNRDGNPDLATANYDTGAAQRNVSVLLGNGSGRLWLPPTTLWWLQIKQ